MRQQVVVYNCNICMSIFFFFFFQAEDGIRDYKVTGVQTCALPIYGEDHGRAPKERVALVQGAEVDRRHCRLPIVAVDHVEIGRASCRGKSVDLGGRRIIKKKKKKY